MSRSPFTHLVTRPLALAVTLGLGPTLTPAVALTQDTAGRSAPVPAPAFDEAAPQAAA